MKSSLRNKVGFYGLQVTVVNLFLILAADFVVNCLILLGHLATFFSWYLPLVLQIFFVADYGYYPLFWRVLLNLLQEMFDPLKWFCISDIIEDEKDFGPSIIGLGNVIKLRLSWCIPRNYLWFLLFPLYKQKFEIKPNSLNITFLKFWLF